MSTEPKVKSIKIEMDGYKIELSVEYALKLRDELNRLFGIKTYSEPTNPQC